MNRDDREIVAAWRALAPGAVAVLGTVVFAEGSTYRRPGARVLILPDDACVGLVSGGCLESDLAERARAVRTSRAPTRVRYDATADEDVVWGLGLGCAGVVDVLLEPITRDAPGPCASLARVLETGETEVIATVVEPGERLALGVPAPAEASARVRERGHPEAVTMNGEEVLVEAILPPARLLILGAGPDVAPVVRGAAALGWDVAVWDWRPAFARAELLPDAHEVVCCPIDDAARVLAPDPGTAAIVMTHHYLHDRALLGWLLRSSVGYVGVLGPKQRTEDLLADLSGEGFVPSDAERARLHGPAGLDIGADGPEEIALALLGEITAFRAERRGGPLRERKGPIH